MAHRVIKWALRRGAVATSPPKTKSSTFLASLPNELLLEILEVMDDKSLHLMVAVSRRFYHLATQSLLSRYEISLVSGYVTVASSEALCALRIALALYQGTLRVFNFQGLERGAILKNVRRIDALLQKFWAGSVRIKRISLGFNNNLIKRPVGWTIGGLAPKLLYTICGDSPAAVFVAANGLFTCKPKSMQYWSAYTRDTYCKVQMHDGSRQWVPSIRSIVTLDITYPICVDLSPIQPWTMIVVDAKSIFTLLLSIKLSRREWAGILASLSLPHLRDVGIWAENIATETSTSFLNRHDIVTLKYMSAVAAILPNAGSPPLRLPHLQKLTALSHYIVHILKDRDSAILFPKLAHVELWPDGSLYEALHLISAHTPLERITFWMLDEFDVSAWPIFPSITHININNTSFEHTKELPALLSHAFPSLRYLFLSHSFPKPGTGARDQNQRAVYEVKSELFKRISHMNPGIEFCVIDAEFFEP
ncbi:hypothetical protein B0H10DRAFT_2009233 [Mycena sp. CBHHK59/15]|nr:hypothetical protein B0H10DRAFT_2009233 [Mycena sp. CBHHK59/15]